LAQQETARIHLRCLNEDASFEVPLTVGESTLVDALPSAYSLLAQATEVAIRHSGAPSCRAGCGACCRHLVMLSVADARVLISEVEAMPEERRSVIRQRFAVGLERLERSGLLGPKGTRGFVVEKEGDEDARRGEITARYFALGIPCPFLEEDSCSIHPVRPLICREYLVTSDPKFCAHYGHEQIEMIPPPLGVAAAMGRVAKAVAGTAHEGVPMLLLFEWMEQEGSKLDAKVDGLDVFRRFLEDLGETRC
jgi:Fe-S-cluster containining protein